MTAAVRVRLGRSVTSKVMRADRRAAATSDSAVYRSTKPSVIRARSCSSDIIRLGRVCTRPRFFVEDLIMKSSWKFTMIVVTILVAGCATQSEQRTPADIATACTDPIPDGAVIVTCQTGVSAANRQTVARDRCIGGVLPRDTRIGTWNRSTLC